MMKKNKFILLFFMCCALSVVAQQQSFDISGTVLDSISGKPLMGVYVTTGKRGSQTDGKGEFLIKGIPAGDVSLYTMYFSSYPTGMKTFCLKKDTTLLFRLSEQSLSLSEVVVTGTRTGKRLSESPVLTSVIREQEIRKSGAVSTLESLQDQIPGIMVTPNGMGNNMRIKGLNSRYILFLIDGERMVSEGAGGNVNLDQIDVSNIKKIEMVNGASSALYGSNAVGAVINIITKDPVHKIEAGANVVGESNHTWKTKVSLGSNLDKFRTHVDFFRNSSDGFGADGGGAYAARYADYGGSVKFGYKPAESLDVNLTGRYFRHETFNPDGSMNVAHPLSQTFTTGINGGYHTEDKKHNLRVSFNYDGFIDDDVLEKKANEKKRNNEISYMSFRIVHTFNPNEVWEIVGGTEYNHEKNYATKTLGVNPTTRKLNDVNVFGQAQYKVIRNLDVMAGARYTYNTQFGSAFTPKLSLMYSSGGWRFRGGIGSAFRAPSIKELYYDFDHQGMFWVYGNPDLKAEKGLYSSISAEYTVRTFNVSVAGYYNRINNKITQYDVINSQGGNEKYYKNVSSATLKGVDVNVSWELFRELVLKGSYSFCDAKDNSTGLQLDSNVKHSATVSVTWNGEIAKSPFSLQLAGRMNSPKLYSEVVTGDSGDQTTLLSQSKTYSIWKVVLVKPFRLNKHTLELTLKVDNLFDFKEASFINPGRQYLVEVRYAFK